MTYAIKNNVVSLADYTTVLHLKHIKRATFYPLPSLSPGQQLCSLKLASLEVLLPGNQQSIELHITALDYFLIRSCYGLNTMAYRLWKGPISKLPFHLKIEVLAEVNDALSIFDVHQYYHGRALQQIFEILKMSAAQVAQITGLDLLELQGVLSDDRELSETSFLTILALFRVYACTLHFPNHKRAASLSRSVRWPWLDHIINNDVNSVSLPEHVIYDESRDIYSIYLGSERIEVNSDDIFLFCVGAKDKLRKNLRLKAASKCLRMIALHHYCLGTLTTNSPIQLVRKVPDVLNPLAYDDEVPPLPMGGVEFDINGTEVLTSTVDLFEIVAGLTIPMILLDAGLDVTESTFNELEVIALHYFLQEQLLHSTWIDTLKAFKISKFDLYQVPPEVLKTCLSPQYACTNTPTWMFLILPCIAARLAGEPTNQ